MFVEYIKIKNIYQFTFLETTFEKKSYICVGENFVGKTNLFKCIKNILCEPALFDNELENDSEIECKINLEDEFQNIKDILICELYFFIIMIII